MKERGSTLIECNVVTREITFPAFAILRYLLTTFNEQEEDKPELLRPKRFVGYTSLRSKNISSRNDRKSYLQSCNDVARFELLCISILLNEKTECRILYLGYSHRLPFIRN